MCEPKMVEIDGLNHIEPRVFFISHSRMGSTVYVGPFYTAEKASEFAEKHRIGSRIIGMIHPSDAVNCDGNLRQEVWH